MWNLYDREWEIMEHRSNDVHRYVIWYIWVIWVTKIQCLTMPRAFKVVVSVWGSASEPSDLIHDVRLVAILACAWKGLENKMTSSKSLFDFLTRKMHFSVFGMKKNCEPSEVSLPFEIVTFTALHLALAPSDGMTSGFLRKVMRAMSCISCWANTLVRIN